MSSMYPLDEEIYLNNFSFVGRFNNSNKVDFKYIGYLFRSNIIRKKIVRGGQGSIRFNLSSNRLKNIVIPLPILE